MRWSAVLLWLRDVKGGGRRRKYAALGWLGWCLLWIVAGALVSACAPTSPPPTITPPPPATTVVIVPTPPRILVTLTPSATPLPPPTATLPYDPLRYAGRWTIRVEATILGHPRFNHIVFKGVGVFQVAADGAIRGQISFTATAEQPLCITTTLNPEPLTAALEGALRRAGDAQDAQMVADITLLPTDPAQATQFQMLCEKPVYETIRTESYLWPALRATRDLRLSFPVESGFTDSSVADLSGPAGGTLYGTLRVESRISR
jgi:hypothetical protein